MAKKVGTRQKPTLREQTKKQMMREVSGVMREALHDQELVDPTMPGAKLDRFSPTARKVPWTIQKFREKYPMDTFIPEETVSVTINGVRIQFVAGEEATVPRPFKGEYENWRRRERQRSRPVEPRPDVIFKLPGAGPLPSIDIEESE